jgi:hypothetical protein
MHGISSIDIEVPGDGKTVRGAYLDWMTTSEVVHPLSAAHRDVIPEPFSSTPPLRAPEQDVEQFGTVTATLAAETMPIGPDVAQAASFQFGIESQPLLAVLPDLADPAYRGEMESVVKEMQFQYTGWLRAQKVVPVASLKTGTNDLIIIAGPAGGMSAIRGTQIQLKYLWDKSDYLLRTR